MDNMQDEQNRQAKIEALRNLRDKGFYEPENDNPEGLNLDEGKSPEQMQDPRDQIRQMNPNEYNNYKQRLQEQMPIQAAPQQMEAQPSPDQTMQQNPQNLINVLKRKREQELMNSLFPQNGQERQ